MKDFLSSLSLALPLTLCLGIAACSDPQGPPVGAQTKSLADSADQVMFGSKFNITDRGLNRAEVEADTAFFFNENTKLVLHPVRAIFFSSIGAKDAVMSGREGTYDTRLAQLTATGDVLIAAVDGRRIRTSFVRFDQRLNLISTDSAFTMSDAEKETRGVGFRANPDLGSVEIIKFISAKAGVVRVPE